jgi:cell division septation protein DedD
MADRTSSAITDASDREFEIVLDNKRLFSLLFIVFVLLGVFFAMGYLMGRNTLPVDTAAGTKTTYPPATDAQSSTKRPSASAEDTPPASDSGKPAASSGGVVTPAEPAPTPRQPDPEPSPALLSVVEPKPGQTFLQVTAIKRPEAEVFVEVLIKKGFKAILAPAPAANTFRVLVGPVEDGDAMSALREQLEKSGFKPIPRRY